MEPGEDCVILPSPVVVVQINKVMYKLCEGHILKGTRTYTDNL